MDYLDPRYTMRLRNTCGYAENDPIPLVEDTDGLGVWDTIEKRFVKYDTRRKEWVPEA